MAEASLQGGAPDVEDGSSHINVAVRCRPLSEAEVANGAVDIVRIMEKNLVILMDPGAAVNDYLRHDKTKEKRYAFDQAFSSDVSTRDIFTTTTQPLINAVMQAYNATCFAYGATGAGKTYSMIGTPQDPGVMLLTVGSLLEQAKYGNKVVKCSFIEVYNETLRDLLAPTRDMPIDIREDPGKGIQVVGVFETEAESLDEVMELLRLGNLARTTEPTAMNVTSSRSHAVLQVTVESADPLSKEVMIGKLSMIDLAGSERASETNNRGVRLLEGANINRSLLALGNCINALATGCSFVPYRDSKLTRLLKDSLGGNCRTVMMANISPSHFTYEDTLNTLKYANRAKNIRITARQNIIKPQTHVSQYQQLIEDLRGEVSLLKGKLTERPKQLILHPLGEGSPGAEEGTLVEAQEAGEHWKEEVVRNLESRTQLQRSLIEVDRGLAQWYVEKDKACTAISRWEDASTACSSPTNAARSSGRWSKPMTIDEWHEQLQQIEESIRENLDTRQSVEEKLHQNKAQGKELQAQLPQRVLNEDLRTFLELIQRVQVLEVERLELDHLREARRAQLEERDQDIETLREQLRLRNEHLAAQRHLLSDEQQQKMPKRVSLLGSTLNESSPVQKRGPMQVMHAWAPAIKEAEEVCGWDNRPLREREPMSDQEREAAGGGLREAVDWRNLEVPHVSQIRGIARIQPPLSSKVPIVPGGQLASKGWREPPHARPSHSADKGPGLLGQGSDAVDAEMQRRAAGIVHVENRQHPIDKSGNRQQQVLKPQTGGPSVVNRTAVGCTSPVTRGSTCPPLRRASPERRIPPPVARRPSGDNNTLGSPSVSHLPPRLIAQGVAPPPRRVPYVVEDKASAPGNRRLRARARSEHSGFRMGRVGRVVVQPK